MEDLNLTPTQALGVALSCVMGDTEMGECQELAIGMKDHLNAMGFVILKDRNVKVGLITKD
jgi:hypothetical protein